MISRKTEYLCAGGGRKQERNVKLQDIDEPKVNALKYEGSIV